MIISQESNKKKMKTLMKMIEKQMYNNIYKNNIINGFIVLLFHWSIVTWAIVYVFLGEVNIYFYIATIIWIMIVVLHIYFRGCILTKIEKHLWKASDWCGPWFLPFKLIDHYIVILSREKMEYIYISWAALIFMTIGVKLYHSE